MKLEPADWQTLLPVFRETFKIWSPGLSRRDYLEYQHKQANHPWARRNLRHLTLSRKGRIVSSLKLSSIDLQTRGHLYKLGGIGAVYTQLECRSMGYASQLVQETIELAKSEKYQGLILFSDIDCDFYARFGFTEIGSADLLIHIPFIKGSPEFPKNIDCGDDGTISLTLEDKCFELHQERLFPEHLEFATRHYRQWLRRQPYGIVRDRSYFSYKLMRETFLHSHSRLAWPALNITKASCNGIVGGYAITESAGGVLRILEIAAPKDFREAIWASLLVRALQEKLMRIRAWEGLARDFAPSFNLKQLIKKTGLDEVLPSGYRGQLNYYNRSWGKGMLLPFDDNLADLHMTAPCPLVELDHL
ncbi:MAG TPA: GNAT family N-acetyltransferase [Candidatus Melainabacteria bacterium]|nr:GNAT family N-acetyltransferase [Candidatus Melainabacteria bacterium]HIN67207.1 GNAT family N-acetyltransferase [Candidatus Obscuribacterales bacterium]